ncbi:MAG: site-specific DNA-methyltransferase [Sulfuritalea sp.]|nr:site-specific DNA-methyltransferase [Sulfuritalea sp.]
METRFVGLMTELFQLDEAEALDFGLYRVIRRHNREVRAFLGEIVADKESRALQGGRLAELLDTAFSTQGHEAQADDKFRLKDLEQQLGLKPGMTQEQREAVLTQAEAIPAAKGLVAEYRSRTETLGQQQTVQQDRAEVLNRLYQFFSRHYQDGDFIVERRYGKGGARYVKSTGEDTEFHWATEDMYYIKSGDIFTDFPVRLVSGQRVLFTVDAESLQATRAALKPNDKAHYALDAASKEGEVIKVRLNYLKGTQSEKHKDEIVTAVQKVGAGDTAESGTDIRRWLGRFIARNQSDFFIHKRLKEALTEDLDIFIKIEVLDTDQLLAGSDLPKRAMKVARIVREVGGQIIDFLAALEDFQKALWEKKKLVFETRYVITLDRLERYCPGWLTENIGIIVEKQRQEWKELGLGDYAKAAGCIRSVIPAQAGIQLALHEPPRIPHGAGYLPLPVDTRNFDAAFKWAMLEAVTATTPLDDALDGVAIQSDNWQALNVLQEKYRQRIQSLYADPPYNTDAGPINYKNGYRSSSWVALIYDRFVQCRKVLLEDGIACATIDDFQQRELHELMDQIFGAPNRIGTVTIRANPSGRPTKTGFSVAHEYGLFYRNGTAGGLDKLERSETQLERYREIDNIGIFEWRNFRREGSNSDRTARRKLYYPIIVKPDFLRIPKLRWNEAQEEWELLEKPKAGETVIFPTDEDGNEKTWRWKHDEVTANLSEFCVRNDRAGRLWVYFKSRPNKSGVLPLTVWVDSKYSATEHGTGVIKKLFGKNVFSYPKSLFAVQDCVKIAGLRNDDGYCLDIFGGSGTTAHALMALNSDDDGKRKFILVEANDYFETVTVRRIKKVAYSLDWDEGIAQGSDGSGGFVRLQQLEQYDDTLESLDAEINEGDSGDLLFENAAFALRYRLDKTTRALYCGVDRFSSPFGYRLKRAEGGGEARPCEVDLVESIPYLLGMDVNRLYRESRGVVILGRNRRGQSVAVFFRDCVAEDSAQWVADKLAQHPADRVYSNDPAGLSFEGCDRLEAIEAIFALQFGRS